MVECEVELVMGLELDIIVEPEVTAAVDEEDMLLAIWLNKEDMLEEDTLLDEVICCWMRKPSCYCSSKATSKYSTSS